MFKLLSKKLSSACSSVSDPAFGLRFHTVVTVIPSAKMKGKKALNLAKSGKYSIKDERKQCDTYQHQPFLALPPVRLFALYCRSF